MKSGGFRLPAPGRRPQLLVALADHVHVQLWRAYREREHDVGVQHVDAGRFGEPWHTGQANRLVDTTKKKTLLGCLWRGRFYHRRKKKMHQKRAKQQ